MRVLGLEPKTYGLKGRCIDDVTIDKNSTCESGEKSSAICSAISLQKYPELKQIIDLWPSLPEPIKQQVLDTVRSVSADNDNQ